MSSTEIIELEGFRLPETSALRRDYTRPVEARTDHYLERFDDRTLVYDCVRLEDRGSFLFTAPRLLNLWPVLRDGLRIGGVAPGRFKRQVLERCELIEVRAPTGKVTLTLEAQEHDIPVRTARTSFLSGMNCAVTINQDNDLAWIADWAGFHVRLHGLQGVVIFDNNSRTYSLGDLADALLRVAGMKRVVVVSAPFPYGPVDGGSGLERPAFLQPAMMNLARRDMLASARAALNTDIDELVWARDDTSVFDAAAARPNSMIKIHGHWAYPPEGTNVPAAQSAHTERSVPSKRCRQKWCAVPSGIFSRFGWGPHLVGGKLVKLVKKDARFELIHCKGTSTGWKSKRFQMPPVEPDAELAALMAQQFGQGTV